MQSWRSALRSAGSTGTGFNALKEAAAKLDRGCWQVCTSESLHTATAYSSLHAARATTTPESQFRKQGFSAMAIDPATQVMGGLHQRTGLKSLLSSHPERCRGGDDVWAGSYCCPLHSLGSWAPGKSTGAHPSWS